MRDPARSFYQALELSIPVDVLSSGIYGASGYLLNQNGDPIAFASTVNELAQGEQALTLRFLAEDFREAQANGPNLLSDLILTDQTNGTLIVLEKDHVYTTAAYFFTQFGEGNIYLPFMYLSGSGQ